MQQQDNLNSFMSFEHKFPEILYLLEIHSGYYKLKNIMMQQLVAAIQNF